MAQPSVHHRVATRRALSTCKMVSYAPRLSLMLLTDPTSKSVHTFCYSSLLRFLVANIAVLTQVTGCLDPTHSLLSPSDDGGQFDVRFPNGAQCTFGGYAASFIEQSVLLF